MLQEYCNSRYLNFDLSIIQNCYVYRHHNQSGNHTASKVRLNRLLLTLLPINSVDKKLLETVFFQRTLGNIAVDKLVMDLLQVHLQICNSTNNILLFFRDNSNEFLYL